MLAARVWCSQTAGTGAGGRPAVGDPGSGFERVAAASIRGGSPLGRPQRAGAAGYWLIRGGGAGARSVRPRPAAMGPVRLERKLFAASSRQPSPGQPATRGHPTSAGRPAAHHLTTSCLRTPLTASHRLHVKVTLTKQPRTPGKPAMGVSYHWLVPARTDGSGPANQRQDPLHAEWRRRGVHHRGRLKDPDNTGSGDRTGSCCWDLITRPRHGLSSRAAGPPAASPHGRPGQQATGGLGQQARHRRARGAQTASQAPGSRRWPQLARWSSPPPTDGPGKFTSTRR